MPFGLMNSPIIFQAMMSHVLRGLNWKFVLVYVDDILIFSRTFEDYLNHLSQVFDRLKHATMKLHPKNLSSESDDDLQFGAKVHLYFASEHATDCQECPIISAVDTENIQNIVDDKPARSARTTKNNVLNFQPSTLILNLVTFLKNQNTVIKLLQRASIFLCQRVFFFIGIRNGAEAWTLSLEESNK
ncbi:unnamed protein product [Mytilus coruscus]|uniref:Reverse transcriptase domain-containing protein n=1 Tax=Mytilus coruscus TaxID=42192 RepID=A0A6J8E6Q4_MYTCO|nr:unnamed protein product [Mytilus coruscus]